MISSLIGGASLAGWFVSILYRIPAVLIAISFHEFAHGYMAYLRGDYTAKMYGRLTINPKAHFDLYGAVCMLLFGFGWANPVPFNYNNLKKPKLDSALIALAGPLMNFLLAAAAIVLWCLLYAINIRVANNEVVARIFDIVLDIVMAVYSLNIGLMVFNLLPVPPLDGSKILFSLLPASAYRFILTYERYGFIILMVILLTGIIDKPLYWLIDIVSISLMRLTHAPYEFYIQYFNLIV